MGDGYTKLFSDIVDSSIWDEDSDTLKVWVALLALSDSEGFVRGSAGWLASRCKINPERCLKALNKFQSPDPNSRTVANGGRRIKEVERGWLILNYVFFRNSRGGLNPVTAQKEKGRIYYATEPDSEEVKIGYSINPWARIKELKVSRPRIAIVATEIGTWETERARHEQFSEFRKEGEWFELSSELKAFIASLPSVVEPTTVVRRSPTTASASASETLRKGDARGKDLPEIEVPSWAEVQTECQKIGLVEWRAQDWFNEMQQSGWRDNKGREVMDWRAYLARVRTWWERDGRPMQPPAAKNGATTGADTIVMQKEYERVLARMKTIKENYGDHQSWDEMDKMEFQTLKSRRAELKTKLGITI